MKRSDVRKYETTFDQIPRITYSQGWKPLDILVFAKIYSAHDNFPISIRRLSEMLNISVGATERSVSRLIEVGAITRSKIDMETYYYVITLDWLVLANKRKSLDSI